MAAVEAVEEVVPTEAMGALSIEPEGWTVPKEVSFVWGGEQFAQKVGANEQTEFRTYAAARAGDLKSVTEILEKNDSNTLLPQMAIMGAADGMEDPKVRANADVLTKVKAVGAFAISKGGSMFWQFRHERYGSSVPVAPTRKVKGSSSSSESKASSSDAKASASASE